MSDKWIRASELADYVYCRRSWWLSRVQQAESENQAEMRAGRRHHGRHGRLVSQAVWARRAAYACLFFLVSLLVYGLLSGI